MQGRRRRMMVVWVHRKQRWAEQGRRTQMSIALVLRRLTVTELEHQTLTAWWRLYCHLSHQTLILIVGSVHRTQRLSEQGHRKLKEHQAVATVDPALQKLMVRQTLTHSVLAAQTPKGR